MNREQRYTLRKAITAENYFILFLQLGFFALMYGAIAGYFPSVVIGIAVMIVSVRCNKAVKDKWRDFVK